MFLCLFYLFMEIDLYLSNLIEDVSTDQWWLQEERREGEMETEKQREKRDSQLVVVMVDLETVGAHWHSNTTTAYHRGHGTHTRC